MVDAIGSDTIRAIAVSGPEMQVKLLQGLGLKVPRCLSFPVSSRLRLTWRLFFLLSRPSSRTARPPSTSSTLLLVCLELWKHQSTEGVVIPVYVLWFRFVHSRCVLLFDCCSVSTTRCLTSYTSASLTLEMAAGVDY